MMMTTDKGCRDKRSLLRRQNEAGTPRSRGGKDVPVFGVDLEGEELEERCLALDEETWGLYSIA